MKSRSFALAAALAGTSLLGLTAHASTSCPNKRLSVTDAHAIVGMVCTLHSSRSTQRLPLLPEEAQLHLHNWNVTKTADGLIVVGVCSQVPRTDDGKTIVVDSGSEIELEFNNDEMDQCNPVITGVVGGATIEVAFTDKMPITEVGIEAHIRRLESVKVGGGMFVWLREQLSSAKMRRGATEQNMNFNGSGGVDFRGLYAHMVGSRSILPNEALRWDFVTNGENGVNQGSSNFLINTSNYVDGPSGSPIPSMANVRERAMNVFYLTGARAVKTSMAGCSKLKFDGTLFDPAAASITNQDCQNFKSSKLGLPRDVYSRQEKVDPVQQAKLVEERKSTVALAKVRSYLSSTVGESANYSLTPNTYETSKRSWSKTDKERGYVVLQRSLSLNGARTSANVVEYRSNAQGVTSKVSYSVDLATIASR